MKKLVIASLIAASSFAVSANQYQSISNASFANVDSDNVYAIDTIYYLDARKALGPYNEFSFINTTSNISAGYVNTDYSDSFGIGGEYFFENFVVGAGVSRNDNDFDDVTYYNASFGYLFTPDLIARINYLDSDVDGADGVFIASAQYNLTLNATDYIGFTANVDDEFDNYGVGAKYYTDLGQGRYLTASANIDAGDYDSWAVASSYYFNQGTSVFANLNKQDDIRVGARYYFNPSFAVTAAYGNNLDTSYDLFELKLTAQF